jgi:hypothetical protein
LNAREFLGGRAKLSKMQTDFHNEVKHLGLERGLEGVRQNIRQLKIFMLKFKSLIMKNI